MANKNDYLITSSPLKALFLFFIPIALGNLFQQFYNLVDSSILGHFVSEQALAASAACISLTNVFIFIGNGFGIGAGVIVGKNFGAQNYRQMKIVVLTAYTTSIVLIFSSLLNIGLDVLFVTRFHFGIAGVAFATLIEGVIQNPQNGEVKALSVSVP